MTHSPSDPATPPQDGLPPSDQFEKITDTLQTLIGLITPLHQLLEAQEKLGDGVTSRLEEIMESLAAISISLKHSAEGLTSLTKAETLSPALDAAMGRIAARQSDMEYRLAEIDAAVQTLMEWLGTPLPAEAAQNA